MNPPLRPQGPQMWRCPQDNKIASLRQIWPTSEPSHKYDKTSKYGHLGTQSSGTMTQNWWSHKRRDHTQAGIRHNHQRGCGSRTFSPLWRRFWLCRLFPVQWIYGILHCARLLPRTGILIAAATAGICAIPSFAPSPVIADVFGFRHLLNLT